MDGTGCAAHAMNLGFATAFMCGCCANSPPEMSAPAAAVWWCMPYSAWIVLLFSYTAEVPPPPPPPPPGEDEGAVVAAEAGEARGWQFIRSWASSSVVACVGGP